MDSSTVLVIEDNELNMKLVRGSLTIGKYTILEALYAETGIQMTHEHHPDLILMDIQLPGMDGLNATKKILSHADLKHIPIVALTSYAMQGDEEKALEAGCKDYITKPIDTKNFLNVIANHFQKN
ncbi:MAG: response regulator [Desulfobacterales bacterium]|jgi:CheY-like chemotaxis protein